MLLTGIMELFLSMKSLFKVYGEKLPLQNRSRSLLWVLKWNDEPFFHSAMPITAFTTVEAIKTPPTIKKARFFLVKPRVSITTAVTKNGMAIMLKVFITLPVRFDKQLMAG